MVFKSQAVPVTWQQRSIRETGAKVPVWRTESVRFLTEGGFSLPKVGTYAKRILS
jgi:hypothetical protein